MKTNVMKVLDRDQKLSELDDRAGSNHFYSLLIFNINYFSFIIVNSFYLFVVTDALQQGASQFEQQAGKLKRKFWLQNLKVCYNIRYWGTLKKYGNSHYASILINNWNIRAYNFLLSDRRKNGFIVKELFNGLLSDLKTLIFVNLVYEYKYMTYFLTNIIRSHLYKHHYLRIVICCLNQ